MKKQEEVIDNFLKTIEERQKKGRISYSFNHSCISQFSVLL